MDKQNSGEIRSFAQGPPSGQLPSQEPRRRAGLRVLGNPCLLAVSSSWASSPLARGLSSARSLLSVLPPVCVLLPLPCLPQAALTPPGSCSCSTHSALQMVPRHTESRVSRHTGLLRARGLLPSSAGSLAVFHPAAPWLRPY